MRLRHALLTLAVALPASLVPSAADHAVPQAVSGAHRQESAGSGFASRVGEPTHRRGGTQFAWLSGASHARWDPCAGPITYRVNPLHLPPHGLSDMKRAFAQISAATGLRFSYVGRTSFVPHRKGQSPLDEPARGRRRPHRVDHAEDRALPAGGSRVRRRIVGRQEQRTHQRDRRPRHHRLHGPDREAEAHQQDDPAPARVRPPGRTDPREGPPADHAPGHLPRGRARTPPATSVVSQRSAPATAASPTAEPQAVTGRRASRVSTQPSRISTTPTTATNAATPNATTDVKRLARRNDAFITVARFGSSWASSE